MQDALFIQLIQELDQLQRRLQSAPHFQRREYLLTHEKSKVA
jgi:hypothetical protein